MLRTVCLSAGAPVDLTGATVEYRMSPAKPGQGPTIIEPAQVLQVTNPDTSISNKGQVGYSPSASDVATPGIYRIEWHVAMPDGQTPVFPSDGYDDLVLEPSL